MPEAATVNCETLATHELVVPAIEFFNIIACATVTVFSFKRTWVPKIPKCTAHFYAVPAHILDIHVIQISNSHDMLNQQKQEMALSVPDPSPREGVGLGTRLDVRLNSVYQNSISDL